MPLSAYTLTEARTAPGAYAKRTRTRSALPTPETAERGRLTGTAATTPRAALGLRAERVTPVPRAAATTGTTPTPATAAWEAISRVRSREPQPVPKITESRKVRGACEATATSSVRLDSACEYATFAERPARKRERA